MGNPLHDPNILIFDETFLYSPQITEDGGTRIEGIYCVQCWLQLNNTVELVELWKSPEIGIAYCPLCNEETFIQNTFEELRNEVKQKLAHEELRIAEYEGYKILKTLKQATPKKPEVN
jgi:hypothetical protein